MRIGDVSRQAGIATSAIRYYERIGLLPRPKRTNGIRQYDHETVHRIGMIRVAQDAGFTLAETKTLLRGVEGSVDSQRGRNGIERLQQLARAKLPELRIALARAEALLELMTAASQCRCPSLEHCASIAKERGLLSS